MDQPTQPTLHPSVESLSADAFNTIKSIGWKLVVDRASAILFALMVSAAAYLLYIQNNDYPLRYHVGEGSKIRQIMDPNEARDFYHPLLMLETAGFLQHWWSVPNEERQIALTGRCASALLAAVGVFAAILAGYAVYGWIGALINGATMSLCPPALIFAHHFKEDASLGGGLLLAVLGLALLLSSRRTSTQLVAAGAVGFGCAVAMSGKYIGTITILPCIVALLIARSSHWSVPVGRIAIFLLTGFATVILINHRAFSDWTRLELQPLAAKDMEWEFQHGTTGHQILALKQPNLYCLKIAAEEIMPHTWLLLGGGLVWMIARRRFSRWGITLAVLLSTYIAALSFNTIPFPRYAFPISLLAFFISGSMASAMLRDMHPHWRRFAIAASIGSIAIFQGARCLHFNHVFEDDTRQQMRNWVAQLPAGTLFSSDNYTELSTEMESGDPWRHPDQPPMRAIVPARMYAAEAGLLDQQVQDGVSYVATCDANYERFFIDGVHPLPGHESTFNQYKQFYEDLFNRGELVWQSKPSVPTHTYLDMDLRIYKITNLRSR